MLPSPARHLVPSLLLMLAASAAFAGGPPLLRFNGAIGVDPLTAAGGTDQLNVVRGINPGGRAWVLRRFEARVHADGSVAARGRGLLFSSGDVIATRGPVAQVVLTLACGPADATAAKYHSEPVPLDLAGNFGVRGLLRGDDGNVAPLAATGCDNPQLLVRASATGGWFAAGILAADDD